MAESAMTVFRAELGRMEPQFARVLPAHLSADRLTRTIESAVVNDPKLLETDRASLWRAAMSAATFGLEVDGRQSAITRYGKKSQWIAMVSGLVTLAHNGGYQIRGQVIRTLDEFEATEEPPSIRHQRPRPGTASAALRGDDNAIVGAYAVARSLTHPDAPPMIEVMDLVDIVRIRDNSSGYKAFKAGKIKDTPWNSDFAAMVRKTPIRSLANHLPWQIQKAVELETRHERDGVETFAVPNDDGTITIDADDVEVLEPGGAGTSEPSAHPEGKLL